MKHANPGIQKVQNNRGIFDIDKTKIYAPFRDNNDFFRLLAENARDLIFHSRVSPTHSFDYVSPSSTYITGYTPEEFYADPFLAKKCIFPEDASLLSDASIWKDPSDIKLLEVRWRRKDGRIIWMEYMISPILDRKGNPEGFNIIAREVTKRKLAEIALLESQRFYASLLENAPHAAMVINADTSVKYVNPTWERLNGWTLSEIVGTKMPYPWWPAECRELYIKAFEQAMKQGSGKGEVISQKKNGELYWIDFNYTSVKNNGELLYMIINSVDITERKKIEEALRESEEKFLNAFNASPESIAITSVKEGRYIDVNESYLRRTGYSREELVGKTTTEIGLWAHEEDRAKMHRMVREHGRVYNEEFEFRTKSGEIRTSLLSVEPITIKGEPCLIGVSLDITPRKQMEKALRESEEKFSVAFLSSPDMMSIVKLKDNTFIEVNDSYTHFTGYSREELVGHETCEFNFWVNPADEKRFDRLLKEQGKIRHEEFQYRMKSGEVRTWLCSVDIINIGGEPCALGVATDITERRQAQKALRESEEKFSVAFRSSPGIMAITSLRDGTFIEVNDSFASCLGYTREELIGHTSAELNILVYPVETERMIKTINERGKLRDAKHSVRAKDGSIHIWLCSADILKINGEPCMLSAATDITRQKETEARLQEHKNMIESILATMPEGVLVIDGKENILLTNKALRKIFYLNSRSVKNKTLVDIFPKKQFLVLHKAVKSRDSAKKTLEFRCQVRGQEKIINCIIVKMDSNRKLLIFSDISKEREEEEKLYLTDRLASIGEMAAGLAHELNNPLTGILALSQMLMNSNLSSEHREDLECINDEAKRAAGIVRNVLLFAHNRAGENSQCSVNEVIKNVLKLCEFEKRVSNITIVKNFEENLPFIPIDHSQLQQVFLNLISNAEAAIKEVNRPGIITITTQRVNNHVNIVFSDNGCGIKKQNIPRIFDPFFTTKPIGQGTGLGLSICYSIIVKHGGKISVKSKENEGTAFTIKMPAVR